MTAGMSRVLRAKRSSGQSAQDGALGTSWHLVEGDDVENDEVVEKHRLCLSLGLLGQGTPEGYVDHEFPPGPSSIDGLQAQEVKKGQEALIDILSAARPTGPDTLLDEDNEETPLEAPRCLCHRRARRNSVRVRCAAVFRRPYYRCSGRTCRFLEMGEKGPSPRASSMNWERFQVGTWATDSFVVVGSDGYRPEDVRFGPEADVSGTAFVDAIAVLAERPELVARLLPNAHAGIEDKTGCHEVRMCIDGRWRAVLVDERLPIRSHEQTAGYNPATSSRSKGEGAEERRHHRRKFDTHNLAFGRAVGNQLWVPLIEKAYAKSYGAYDFALPGVSLSEVFQDLTGAAVETVLLPEQSQVEKPEGDHLWQQLQGWCHDRAVVACTGRIPVASTDRAGVHALLECASAGDLRLRAAGLRSTDRAVLLRNPRTGFNVAADLSTSLAMVLGRPAQAATSGEGCFWVQYPDDFLSAFRQLDVCYASVTGGLKYHSSSFVGEFAPGSPGIRGCGLLLRTKRPKCTRSGGGHDVQLENPSDGAEVPCWVSLIQPLPRGARLLKPAVGRVLNDIGFAVLDVGSGMDAALSAKPKCVAVGGMAPSVTCKVGLVPGREYAVVPFSLLARAGRVTVRLQSAQPLECRALPSPGLARECWDCLLNAEELAEVREAWSAPSPVQHLPPAVGHVEVARVFALSQGSRSDAVMVKLLRFSGAAVAIMDNRDDKAGAHVQCELEASHGHIYTSRGPVFGDWLADRNELAYSAAGHDISTLPDWRRYRVEDVIPPASRQLLFVANSAAGDVFKVDVVSLTATEFPADSISGRPSDHPFAPHSQENGIRLLPGAVDNASSEAEVVYDEDAALELALSISLQEASYPDKIVAEKQVKKNGAGRWARRDRARTCAICSEERSSWLEQKCCTVSICMLCTSQWVRAQVIDDAVPLASVPCPSCSVPMGRASSLALLEAEDVQRALRMEQDRTAVTRRGWKSSTSTVDETERQSLAQLGIKFCPSCGTGVQKESETCHKMICRTCRAKFCYRCLARLEFFNCGCTGPEHGFIDPVNGHFQSHQ
mmetsp:Transcript_51570/g.122674  ORF Transcript_51570/g.122674 Transcript_51570/m.122674 type:complete len:1059 (+) Transcript_51570:45-3221(+)